jgi:hypothetical protein
MNRSVGERYANLECRLYDGSGGPTRLNLSATIEVGCGYPRSAGAGATETPGNYPSKLYE